MASEIELKNKKDKDELDFDDDPMRIIIPRDYATSVHITKFDESKFPSRLEERLVVLYFKE